MTDAWYLRALYDKSSGAYISTGARWVEGEPSLEYRFTLIESEDESVAWQGGLEKYWLEEDDHPCGEVIVFAEYDNEAAFDAEVAQIQQEAKERSLRENIDEFLAVTDIVKQRTILLGYEEEDLEDMEGLFEDGPEDAYSLRDWDDRPRLHHHVECADEC